MIAPRRPIGDSNRAFTRPLRPLPTLHIAPLRPERLVSRDPVQPDPFQMVNTMLDFFLAAAGTGLILLMGAYAELCERI